jgi:hypothetical protein
MPKMDEVELFIYLTRLSEEVYLHLALKYSKVLRSIKEQYGNFLPKRIKNIKEGIEREIMVMKALTTKGIPFLKSPVDLMDDLVLFYKNLKAFKECHKISKEELLYKPLAIYKLAKKLYKTSYWKKFYQEELRGFPDFIIVHVFEGISIQPLEVKRTKLIWLT